MSLALADPEVLDLFAGPGGWDEGLRILDPDFAARTVGVEWDEAACATAEAAGHRRVCADMRSSRPVLGRYKGIIASPPCQGFSIAGLRLGAEDAGRILRHIRRVLGAGRWLKPSLAAWHDDKSELVLEPLRWVLGVMPEWSCWEQVPGVLPIWEAAAEVLRAAGYSVWTGIITSERYGVPQTRRRAVLIASRTREVHEPIATHSRFYTRDRDRLDEGVLPWVSMADALAWGMTERPSMTVTAGGTRSGGAEPFGNGARQGMLRELHAGKWQMATGTRPRSSVRHADEPAPTFAFGHDAASHVWTPAGMTPVEVVAWKLNQADVNVRVTVQEAGILQSFPADYPWWGRQGKQYEQVGNAVPPLMATAVLSVVL